MRPMTTILIVGSISLLPLKIQAQEIQLNCQVERSVELKSGKEIAPESFSAIVRMTQDGTATIDATTGFCFNYVGSFSEQEVDGSCERTVSIAGKNEKFTARLTINRFNGAFDHSLMTGLSIYSSSGRCTPGKKLF